MTDFKKELVSFIRKIYNSSEFIPLHQPLFKGNEKKYLLDTIDSTFVSSVGEYVEEFETMICDYTGSKYAIATTNGTAALHTALVLANIEENVSASRSRIQDTDFATETAELSRNQIVQQASVSILAQANQQPQLALKLLA